MAELFANSGDPDQTTNSVASDQGLHCLPIVFDSSYQTIRCFRFK